MIVISTKKKLWEDISEEECPWESREEEWRMLFGGKK
jgi:hypothetical protein